MNGHPTLSPIGPEPFSNLAPTYNISYPEAMGPDMAHHIHDSGLFRPNSYHDRSHLLHHSDSHTSGFGPDPEFVQSLHSIRGTGSSPVQGQLNGMNVANGPTTSEAVVAETIVRARKSWKTVKGRSEPVWPPEVEKALVQGLLQYRPNDAQFARALGRFPKRNRYISDYIFAVTGVRRTPKQVGSRLQQLKDVSCGKMLLNHVASWSQLPGVSESGSASPSGHDISLEHQPDLDAILGELQDHSSGSEGPWSPVIPLGGMDRESSLPISAYSAEVPYLYPTHVQDSYPQGIWFTVDQCLAMTSQL